MKQTRDKGDDYDALYAHLIGELSEEDMTPHQLERLARVRSAFTMLISNRKSNLKIVKILKKEFSISQSQAWRDIRLSERVYGEARKGNKLFKRLQAEEMAKETWRQAMKAGKFTAAASAFKGFIIASGCADNDPDVPDPERLTPGYYAFMLGEEMEKYFKAFIRANPVLDITKQVNDAKEYTDFEDLGNGGAEGEEKAAAEDKGGD